MIILIIVLVSITIAFFWVRGIDNMKKNHPDYKGEDFLNWDVEKNTAGRDLWDDDEFHTEGEI